MSRLIKYAENLIIYAKLWFPSNNSKNRRQIFTKFGGLMKAIENTGQVRIWGPQFKRSMVKAH